MDSGLKKRQVFGGGRPSGPPIDKAGSSSHRLHQCRQQNEDRQEEIFGPVLVVIPYDGDEQAVEIANDSNYGLCGSGDG